MKSRKIVLTGMLMLCAVQLMADSGVFRLVKIQSAISLYERWINHGNDQVRELKAEFTLRTVSTEQLASLLQDGPAGLKWQLHTSEYKVRRGSVPATWVVYMRYAIPWPMKDYDCVLKYRIRDAPGPGLTREIVFSGTTHPDFPEKAGVSRIGGIHGKWVLSPLGDGSVKLTYLVTSARSSVPRWISDPVVHENLFASMMRLRTLLDTAASPAGI